MSTSARLLEMGNRSIPRGTGAVEVRIFPIRCSALFLPSRNRLGNSNGAPRHVPE